MKEKLEMIIKLWHDGSGSGLGLCVIAKVTGLLQGWDDHSAGGGETEFCSQDNRQVRGAGGSRHQETGGPPILLSTLNLS